MSTDMDFNQELRERLIHVLGDTSQSEIARRTGTIRNNVNRYFSGRRMPADFCAAVMEAFNINPTWLFTGQGSPRLTEQALGMEEKVDDLLGLVNSMQAVMKLRMGEVVGKAHLKELRKLSDALDAHQSLRDKLNKQFTPTLKSLLAEYESAVGKMDYGKVDGLRKVITQVSEICDDRDLHIAFQQQESRYYGNVREIEKSLEAGRKGFWLTLLQEDLDIPKLTTYAGHYAIDLISSGRIYEARGILSAVIGTLEGNTAPDVQSRLWYTQFTYALTGCHLGDIENSLNTLMRAYRKMPDDLKAGSRIALMSVLTAAGVMPLEERMQINTDESNPSYSAYDAGDIILYACFQQDPKLLKRARKLYSDALKHVPEARAQYWNVFSQSLLNALNGKQDALRTFEENDAVKKRGNDPNPLHSFSVPVGACQIACASELYSEAVDYVKQVEKIRQACPAHIKLPITAVARHMKNILAIHEAGKLPARNKSLATQATDFLEKYASQGYAIFELS